MKKRLEAELISIAHRILKLKGKSELNQLHQETQKLYEALSVLKFVDENIDIVKPKMDVANVEEKLETAFDTKPESVIVEEKEEEIIPKIILAAAEEEKLIEIEKIAFEPAFELQKEADIEVIPEEKIEKKPEIITDTKPEPMQISFEELLGHQYNNEPVFDKVSDKKETVLDQKSEPKTTTNDKAGIVFGLNDRIGFIKHLFDDSSEDFNRVSSQLSTFDTFDEAKDFVENMVKPDYNNWEGSEDYAERFMEVVAKKFS